VSIIQPLLSKKPRVVATHDTWDDKLIPSLERELVNAYGVLYLRIPNEANPRYSAWKTALPDEFDGL
jgi:hypothetical protein